MTDPTRRSRSRFHSTVSPSAPARDKPPDSEEIEDETKTIKDQLKEVLRRVKQLEADLKRIAAKIQ
jgi:seryl-tRNA synthetase